MNGADPQQWSAAAADWDQLWGDTALPVWRAVVDAIGMGPGQRVLDVGCGGGHFLAHLDRLGVATAGIDPAPGMLDLTRSRVTAADIQHGSFERLPWPDSQFDAVTAFNSLQFSPDPELALAAMVRVTRAAGHVVIANWAEDERNDLATLEAAVAGSTGVDLPPCGPLRQPGGLEVLLGRASLDVVASGLVGVPWEARDDDALVRGVMFGEEPTRAATAEPLVLAAARHFGTPAGGYRLDNAFRFAIGRRRARPQPSSVSP